MAENDLHVIPVNDTKEHVLSASCWCDLKVEIHGADLLVIHNAADFREVYEWIDNGMQLDLMDVE